MPQVSWRAPPYFCVLVVSSMGRPMSLLPSSKLGSKYSSGVMAVGLVWLRVCVISVCAGTSKGLVSTARLGLLCSNAVPSPPPATGAVLVSEPPPAQPTTHPIAGPHMLLGDPQEGLQRGLAACRETGTKHGAATPVAPRLGQRRGLPASPSQRRMGKLWGCRGRNRAQPLEPALTFALGLVLVGEVLRPRPCDQLHVGRAVNLQGGARMPEAAALSAR